MAETQKLNASHWQLDEKLAMRVKLPKKDEPAAADIRESADGEKNSLLKLVAGLIGVGLDELKQRDLQTERASQNRCYIMFTCYFCNRSGSLCTFSTATGEIGPCKC